MRHFCTLVITSMLLCPAYALALVNINTASLAELDTLPGVGEVTAERIIAARPFSAASDIQNVKGIGGPGSKTYDDIIGLITVSGATTATVADDEDNDESEDDEEKEEKVYVPVGGLRLTAPKIAYVNQPVDFKVEPANGRKDRLVRYHWNFGDGQVGDSAAVTHAYKYPGTYVVVAESYYLKEEKTARHEIEVLPVEVSLKTNQDGTVTVKNEGDEELDLSGMTLKGGGEFVFPKHSILMPGKSVTVTLPTPAQRSSVALMDQSGKVAATSISSPAPAPRKTVASAAVAKPEAAETAASFFGPVAEAAEPSPSAAAAEPENEHWPYLGLLLLIGVGLYPLFGSGPKGSG